MILGQLLDPMSLDFFLRKHWGQTPAGFQRLAQTAFTDVPRIPQLLESVQQERLVFGRDLTLISDKQPFPPDFSELAASQVLNEFRNGSTIKVTNATRHFLSLAELVRDSEQQFHCHVSCNLYLTPPFSSGLPAHFDTHDVFVVQLDGTKRWHWYDQRMKFPLEVHRHAFIEEESIRQPSREFDVEARDAFYMPRGLIHQATCLDQASLHLTLGIRIVTWRQMLESYLDVLAEESETLRQGIPPASLFSPDGVPRLRKGMEAALASIVRPGHFDAAIRARAQQETAKLAGNGECSGS